MRYVSFQVDDQIRYGRVDEDDIIELSSNFPQWKTLKDVVANQGFDQLDEVASGKEATHALEQVELTIPIPDPPKILCVGVNYPARNEEFDDGKPPPEYPSLFVRFPCSLVGHGRPVIIPRETTQLDYEGEIAIIIGKRGRRISQADAYDHIAGMTLCNEASVRDWMRHGKFNVTQGKNFDRSGSMGPWFNRYVERSQLDDIELKTWINGELRQRDRTSRMIFSFARIIEYVSTFMTLLPGDVINTGTPTGNGSFQKPPKFLKEGDIIEIEADGLGRLVNSVENEQC